MELQNINRGAYGNDPSAEPIYDAFGKVIGNFEQLEEAVNGLSSGDAILTFNTLADAQDYYAGADPVPVNGTNFQVSKVTDAVNAGYYTFQSGEAEGTRFERYFITKISVVEEGNTDVVESGAVESYVRFPKSVTENYFQESDILQAKSFDNVTYPPAAADTGSTFSGWETAVGAPQNFTKVKFKIVTRSSIVTNVKVRVYDVDDAVVLVEKDITGLSLAAVTAHDFTVDFEEVIANASGHNLRFAYLCDQLIDRYGISNSAVYPYPAYALAKYRTEGNMDFEGMIATAVSGNNNRVIYAEFYSEQFEAKPVLVDEMSVKIPEIAQVPPIKAQTDDALEWITRVEGEETFEVGDGVYRDTTGVFSGWGTPIGIHNNFTHISGRIKARSTQITSVYFELRENDKDGSLLASGTVLVTIPALTEGDVFYPMGSEIENAGNVPLWFGFKANQLCDTFGFPSGGTYPYPNPPYGGTGYAVNGSQTVGGWSVSGGTRNLWLSIGVYRVFTAPTDSFTDAIAEKLNITTPETVAVDILLPDEIYGVELLEHNIYFDTAVVLPYGVKNDVFTIDLTGSKGAQYKKMWRFIPTGSEAGTYSLKLDVKEKRTIIATKTTSVKIADSAAGTGITRKVLIIGDSTVDGDDITTPLKAYFDADVMDVVFVGTRGASGLKHEGRSGWTINDYATIGRVLYKFNVSGLGSVPALNDVYSNNGSQFKVVEINITGGDGYINTERTSGSNNPILTADSLAKVSGSGPSTISYTTAEVESANPFWNGSAFDFEMYLTDTSQTMSAGDWVFFQLGINDMFSQTSLSGAQSKADAMWVQLQEMMDNIQSAVPGVRIGVLLTIPPAASQDAFAANYSNGQNREMYFKTGWLTWNKKLLEVFDTPESKALLRYVVAAALNLDTENNFPTETVQVNSRNTDTIVRQNNGVHPAAVGNSQIADSYAGIIKYFA